MSRWTLSVQPTCTPRVGHSARSVPSWAFIGSRSANSSRVPALPCDAVDLPLIPPLHNGSLELRDQGLTWTEVAEQVDMTVSGAWSRYRRARPPESPAWAAGSRCSPTHLIRT